MPRWLDERESRVWRAHLALHTELQAVLERRLLADSGLSLADYALLVPLSESPDGVVRARDLAASVGWERSRLSHHLTRMQRRGLIARETCPDDARGAMVRITPDGMSAITAAAPTHVADVRRTFIDHLTPADLTSLDDIYTRLRAVLAEESDL
ncbi:MarR family winged helix-turn-helix transcriptional regulator [Actinokineospora cianjurensis]|uniref:DNA-binding MarR family transcriptional regulator n=1 Tax=Actinokineospora cianjurensis TaxID=585224 RepID=A0A421AYD4_9PSEU|nr:MarR family winged helix-turn-helix transcriptional regulator [Actinokineospora cianjurensis]RLK54856.1 DNA-binding MarR family transcriptional regulator [Actinokineospora cianjurensis]